MTKVRSRVLGIKNRTENWKTARYLETNVLIEYERGRLNLEPHLAERGQEEFFLSVISASELLHGVHGAANPQIRMKRSAFVEALLERFPLLPVDLTTARVHAQVCAELARAGRLIGPNDLWGRGHGPCPRPDRRHGQRARVRSCSRPRRRSLDLTLSN